MSFIMKGIVDESGESVYVIYINDRAATKYAKEHEAKADVEKLRAKFPDKKIEVKQEVRESEAKKGADGKRCWKGKRFAGTENGKDKCIPVGEAAGTPGGAEMFRTPSMVNATMQQNLYKRDLKPIKDAEKKKKDAEYRKANPPKKIPTLVFGASSFSVPVIQAWNDKRDLNSAIDFIVNKFAHKQSREFKSELAADPDIKDAVVYFFDTAVKILDLSKQIKKKPSCKFTDEAEELRHAGFDVVRRINQIMLKYLKKFGVDKTGRRVPPEFNYNLEEARPMSPGLRAAQQNLVDLASGEVRKREDAKRAAAKRQREQERETNRKPAKPTLDQIWQKVEHAISNYFPDGDPTDYLNPYMQKTGITWDDITRAAKKNGYKDLWDYWNTLAQDIENDAYADWHISGGKNVRARAPFMEDPYEAVEEDTAYAGGMGQGGNSGQSYRKFKPKSAGTFKESAIMKGIKREGF